MFKSILVAGGIALTALAGATSAEARHHGHDSRAGFSLYFGVPFYGYRVGPGWRYYDGYGWYDYGRYGDFSRRHHRGWLTCNQARRLVDRSGYDRVRTVECNGRTYTFRALRNGHRVTVYVNARSGGIWR